MQKLAALLIVALGAVLLAACTAGPEADAPAATSTPIAAPATPTPSPAAMPAWAQEMSWLIYPDDMKCVGTEGCPNDYVSAFGEPGPVLPENVEYYDPAKHDCTFVHPVDVDCYGEVLPVDACVHSPMGRIDYPNYAYNTKPNVTVPELVGEISDTRPREFATGEPTLNDEGLIASYTVQPGDAVDAIAARFCLDANSFVGFNNKIGQVIQPGEVLVLRPGSE